MSAKKITESSSRLRNDHNRDLIRRMRNGESLTSFDSKASWYPPRPIIEKDLQALARVYGQADHQPSDVNAVETSKYVEKAKNRLNLRLV